jgi:hypothetical protein
MPVGAAFNVLIPPVDAAVFLHRATAGNILVGSTYIDHPLTDNQPNAIVFVTPNWNPGGVGSTYNAHPVGVWYDDLKHKWAIFNEDQSAMPPGAAFNVLICPAGPAVFVQKATAGNTTQSSTYLDHPRANDRRSVIVFATPNWNPGGGGGTLDNHVIGVWYNTSPHRWAVFNEDEADMPVKAAFNVLVTSNQVYLPLIGRKH